MTSVNVDTAPGYPDLAHLARSSALLSLAALAIVGALGLATVDEAQAGGMICRKVVAPEASAEGRNALKASRVKCHADEFLTGGVCYPSERPEADGSCQTSAMGIIQTISDAVDTTMGAFYTCLQTGGTDCPVEQRTRAMAICCKFSDSE